MTLGGWGWLLEEHRGLKLLTPPDLGGTSGKEPACQCKRHKRCKSDPRVGKSPGGGHGNPLQYSCLENPMDRRFWWATVHRVAKSQTWLKRLSMQHNMSNDLIPHVYTTWFPLKTLRGSESPFRSVTTRSHWKGGMLQESSEAPHFFPHTLPGASLPFDCSWVVSFMRTK